MNSNILVVIWNILSLFLNRKLVFGCFCWARYQTDTMLGDCGDFLEMEGSNHWDYYYQEWAASNAGASRVTREWSPWFVSSPPGSRSPETQDLPRIPIVCPSYKHRIWSHSGCKAPAVEVPWRVQFDYCRILLPTGSNWNRSMTSALGLMVMGTVHLTYLTWSLINDGDDSNRRTKTSDGWRKKTH